MEKFNPINIMMTEMYMWICQMCMCFCALISDAFSIPKARHVPA